MDGSSLLPEAYLGWHQIQESLSRLTGLEFALYNKVGQPVGMVSGESPFCRSIRRSGFDGAFCESQCGKYIRQAVLGEEEVVTFTCASGQNVFLIPVRHGSVRLVVSGGKTFAGREEYKKAVRMIKASGGKISITGKHRYRFIGKRRMAEVIALARNAAIQHFQVSHHKFAYQLRHNRQAALLESIGLLYMEKGVADVALSLLRSVTALFEVDTASLILYEKKGSTPDAHYVFGERAEAVRAAGEPLEMIVREALESRAGDYAMLDKAALSEAAGTGFEAAPALAIPFKRDGRLSGALCLYGPEIKTEDIPALKTYFAQSAAIIENRGLREILGERVERLKALMALGSQMNKIGDPDRLLEFVFDWSAKLLQAERGSLMLLNEKTDELVIRSSLGIPEEVCRGLRVKAGEGIAGKVAKECEPMVVEDLEKTLSVLKRPTYRTKSFISLPLMADGRVIGVINLADKISGKVFSHEDLELITSFASQASIAIEKARLAESVEALKQKMIYDLETGLLNAGYFGQRLFEETDRARRHNKRFTLMLMEIGGAGGPGGGGGEDEILKTASETVRAAVRMNDVVGRLGLRQLGFILPETGREMVSFLAERVRGKLGDIPGGDVRFGSAGYPEDAKDAEGLLKAARKELKAE